MYKLLYVYYWRNGAMSYLKYTFLYFKNRNIKRTTTKIIHGNSMDKKHNNLTCSIISSKVMNKNIIMIYDYYLYKHFQ